MGNKGTPASVLRRRGRLHPAMGEGILIWAAALVSCIFWVSVAQAQRLSKAQIERVKACKTILREVDDKPLQSIINDLENRPYPEENLQILEAVAGTYEEIVREQNLTDLAQKERLHGMIRLNMAYLQFGGSEDTVGGASGLNYWICRKLKAHLPAAIWNHPGIFHSIE